MIETPAQAAATKRHILHTHNNQPNNEHLLKHPEYHFSRLTTTLHYNTTASVVFLLHFRPIYQVIFVGQ